MITTAEKALIPAEEKMGFPTQVKVNPVTEDVATTATLILRNNPDRIFYLIVNLAINRGFIGMDAQVSSDRGIPMAAEGGFASMSVIEDGEAVIYPIWAVLENAAGKFYVVEIEKRG